MYTSCAMKLTNSRESFFSNNYPVSYRIQRSVPLISCNSFSECLSQGIGGQPQARWVFQLLKLYDRITGRHKERDALLNRKRRLKMSLEIKEKERNAEIDKLKAEILNE